MELKQTGVVYRNPKPHVRSRHAYFPSVVNLGEGELLCSFVMGEAFESADCRIFLARSSDRGVTWSLEGRMLPESDSGIYSEACRIARCEDGSIVANVFRYDRRRTEEGLANPATLGLVETQIDLYRSEDRGHYWAGPQSIPPPLVGPEFELCSPILMLSDSLWLMPTSTWKAWEGADPTGMKAVAFVSRDEGKSWPEYVDVMDGTGEGILYWEHKIVELQPGCLLAVAWAYDDPRGRDLPNAFALSTEGGRSFSHPESTGLCGQTPAVLPLGKDRVLCVYRRMEVPGLWAAEVSIAKGRWQTESQFALWGAPDLVSQHEPRTMVEKFNVLKFGAPSLTRLDSGEVLVAFWCVEESVSNIRWVVFG